MATAEISLPKKKTRRRIKFSDVLIWIALILGLVFFLMPIYVMVVNGLKEATNVSLSTMWQLPTTLSGGGFAEATRRLWDNMQNSFLMVIPATIISSFLGSLNGYLLSKWKFPGSDVLFLIMLFGFFIPYQVVLFPLVRFLQLIHLYGTIPGLILCHVVYGLPITTLMFRNYFAGVPTELIEAASVDGSGLMTTFWKIMLPLSVPAFIVVGIFQFTNIWNDFLFGVTVVPNPASQPVTIALNNLSGSFSVDWNVVMAGAVVAALPTALVYVFLGRYFVRGLLAGSVKG
jgi:glucose/mannose transport system permease protein